MQFIAEDPVHVVIRNEVPALHDTQGRLVHPPRRRLFAKFQRGVAPQWARDIGGGMFEFRRRPEGVTPEQWLAFYDSVEDQETQGWTDEEREAIEEKLQRTHSAVIVSKPKLAPPWPAYDTLVTKKGVSVQNVAEKIAAKVSEDGYDPHAVIAYELENQAREQVVKALEELVGAPAPEPEAVEEEDGLLIEA